MGQFYSLNVQEIDGSPNVKAVKKILLPNGTVTDNGAGSITLTPSDEGVESGSYKFNTSTTMADPGSGNLRVNASGMLTATAIALSKTSNSGASVSKLFNALRTGDSIYIHNLDDTGIFARYTLTANPVDNGTWYQLSVSSLTGSGLVPSNNANLYLSVTRLPANVVFLNKTSQVFTVPVTFGDTLTIRQSGGVAGTDQLEVSHDGSAAKIRNRDTGGITIYSSADALKLTFVDDGTIRGNTQLVLEQTGDQHGTTRLKLQDRDSCVGAVFEQAGSVDLVDFQFKTLSHTMMLRTESRGGSALSGVTPEIEFAKAGSTPSFIVTEEAAHVWRGLRINRLNPTALSANTNNYSPGRNAWQRWSATTPVNVTGMVAGYDGEFRWIMNGSANAITFKQQDANSSAGNKFYSHTTADVVLNGGRVMLCIYDSTDSVWRIFLLP